MVDVFWLLGITDDVLDWLLRSHTGIFTVEKVDSIAPLTMHVGFHNKFVVWKVLILEI